MLPITERPQNIEKHVVFTCAWMRKKRKRERDIQEKCGSIRLQHDTSKYLKLHSNLDERKTKWNS